MNDLQQIDIILKGMPQGCRVCPACGYTRLISKTFYDECFSCHNVIWKSFLKPATKKVRENKKMEDRLVSQPQNQRI